MVATYLNTRPNQSAEWLNIWIIIASMFMVLISFDTLLVNIFGASFLTYLPNLVLVPFVAIVVTDLHRGVVQRSVLHTIICFGGLFTTSILSIYYQGLVATLLAVMLFLKFFYIQVVLSKTVIEDFDKPIKIYLIVHLAGFLVSLLAPNLSIFSEVDLTERICGFQLNSNAFAFASAVLALYYIFIKRNISIFVILVLTIFASGSRSGMLMLFLGLTYLAHIQGKLQGQLLKLFGFVLAVIAGFLFKDRFLDTYDAAQSTLDGIGLYVRVAMLVGGFDLALAHFPIGTGAATFGSPLAESSPAYGDAGVADLPTVIAGTGIYDSGVGTILGEYGVLGMVLVLWLCFRGALAFGRGALSITDAFMFVGLVLLMSFFRNVISSYYYSGILLLFLLVLISLRQKYRG